MSTPSAARRDARMDFYPGSDKPEVYRSADSYYQKCYNEFWEKLQKESERETTLVGLTLEERVAVLEDQVKRLREAGGL